MLVVAGNTVACSHHQSSISTDGNGAAIYKSNSMHHGECCPTAGFRNRLPSIYPTLCNKKIQVSPKIRALIYGTLSLTQTPWTLEG